MKIYIKNMFCIRCKMVVKEQLKKIMSDSAVVKLGEVEIAGTLTNAQLNEFRSALLKKVIVELIDFEGEPLKINFSTYLSNKLNYEYTYMANLFSEVEGINVEHYLISHKIERVKELLVYDKLSLTEISYKLNYSSVAHLCNQFKKITGTTPSVFRKAKNETYLQVT